MPKAKKRDEEAVLSYFRNAAKQVKYPVDIYERTIDVPENELDEAAEDLMIKHLLNNGFHIQSRIPEDVHIKEVFDPHIRLSGGRTNVKVEAVKDERYIVGDRFYSKSTENEMECVRVADKKAELKYNGLDPRIRKKNVLVSFDQLDSQILRGNLIKLTNLIKK